MCAQCILSVHTSTINSETRYAGSVASLFTKAVCCYSTNSCLLSLWRIMSQATKQSCPSDFFFFRSCYIGISKEKAVSGQQRDALISLGAIRYLGLFG